MVLRFLSPSLKDTLQESWQRNKTGYISVTSREQGATTYGTLQVKEGELLKADYAGKQGLAALEALAQLKHPEVNFTQSNIQDSRDHDIPSMASLFSNTTQVGNSRTAARRTQSQGIRFGIFPQVLLTMLFIALIPLAGFWYVNNVRVKQQLETDAEQALQSTAANLTIRVNDWVDTMTRALNQNASLGAIKSMNAEEQIPVLETVNETYEWTYLAFVTGLDGQSVGRSDSGDSRFYGDRIWFQKPLEGEAIGRQVLLGRSNGGKPAVTLAKAIYDDAGQALGVLAMANNLTDVSAAVADVEIGETGFAMLVDDQGRLIAHGDESFVAEELQDISTHPALAAQIGDVVTYENELGERVVAYTQEAALGWRLIVQQDYQDAFATVISSQRVGLFLILATILLVLLTAFMLGRRLAKPIENLTSVADGISRGQLDSNIGEVRRSDEIGVLAGAIDRLQVSMRMALAELSSKN